MEIRPVEVLDMLRARDLRVERQRALLIRRGGPLISFTMNIAGAVKRDEWIERAFFEGVARIERALGERGVRVAERLRTVEFTGCEQIWAVDASAPDLKRWMCAIEDADALGRLFDIDVIGPDGGKLARNQERRCLICGGPVRACARSRAHGAEELSARAHEIIREFFNERRAAEIGALARRALIQEAITTPKPGLVDLENSGAHRDMDLAAFLASAEALLPWFEDCARIGMALRGAPAQEVFARLRGRGLGAEREMYAATGGVNTHKGALFSLGLLCCAAATAGEGASAAEVLDRAAELARPSLEDFAGLRPGDGRTGGERQYLESGHTGVRGEAAAGFPNVRNHALPALRRALGAGEAANLPEAARLNEAGLHALLALMAHVDDSNILRRRGPEALRRVQSRAAGLLERGFTSDDLRDMNDAFTRENISPGGSADLLAVCYFLYFMEEGCRAAEAPDTETVRGES